ncbi:MAG: hypothetical protein ACLGH0_03855 [Thermoanaerobaculia bacterium]
MASQALIFTHVGDRENLQNPGQLQAFVARRQPFFQACLQCRNVGIVFVYSSYGVEFFVHALKTTAKPKLPLHVLETEQHIFDAIHIAIDQAAKSLGVSSGPKFVLIGVRELASHLLRLQRMDPELVRSLATREGTFTYDSPKYVEAILRLARAQGDPILRVDIDVEINENAVQKLLDQAALCTEQPAPFWWFSGCYSGNGPNDPVNVHAVRQHWLVTKKPGTANEYVLPKAAESFLVDLAEVGATQLVPEPIDSPRDDVRLSPAAGAVIDRRGYSKNRRKPQVISGAGLIASHHTIRRLPPFMNAPEMVVWIDDHLKRLLHEAIGDIDFTDPERIEAPMKQDRFPNGIERNDDRTRDYFRRLLNGCLLEAAIQYTPFTDAIHAIVNNRRRRRGAELLAGIEEAVRQRYADAIYIWRNANYGNELLSRWASSLTEDDEDAFCSGTVNTCRDYLELCRLWPQHVRAITDLWPQHAYWLFTEPGAPRAVPRKTSARGTPRIPLRGTKKGSKPRTPPRKRPVV